jgi:hypothetical protein
MNEISECLSIAKRKKKRKGGEKGAGVKILTLQLSHPLGVRVVE